MRGNALEIADPISARTPEAMEPAILIKARELSAQRLMLVYAVTGLFFMLLPGTFLGVWNLISISGHHGVEISAAWIQAHGHAQIFGWIGTFIMGIGFYSIPKMTARSPFAAARRWTAWLLWTSGALLRWATGVYQWHWRVVLPLSAALELTAFLIFLMSVQQHPPSDAKHRSRTFPVWILAVLTGTLGFGLGMAMNLAAAIYVSLRSTTPAFPNTFESRFLALLAFAFIVPTIWGFSARWLPVFLGLKPVKENVLKLALLLSLTGVLLAQIGFLKVAPWLFAIAAVVSITAFHLFEAPQHSPKTVGVHKSFPLFVRIAYSWLFIATLLGIAAAYLDRNNGWVGASRHALTVGFISTMVFAIGQRVLPAFAGMRVLYSKRLMGISLILLTLGCGLRVSSEILAYEGYWSAAWLALPWSAVTELSAVTAFAVNLLLTFRQPPAHQMHPVSS